MSHPDDALLLDHALGLLDERQVTGVQGHLASCAACRDRSVALRAEQDALAAGLSAGSGSGVDVDADAARRVERRVLDALRAPTAASARRRGPARRLLAAAAIGLVAGGLVLFADQREQAVRRATLVRRVQSSERAALGEGAR